MSYKLVSNQWEIPLILLNVTEYQMDPDEIPLKQKQIKNQTDPKYTSLIQDFQMYN